MCASHRIALQECCVVGVCFLPLVLCALILFCFVLFVAVFFLGCCLFWFVVVVVVIVAASWISARVDGLQRFGRAFLLLPLRVAAFHLPLCLLLLLVFGSVSLVFDSVLKFAVRRILSQLFLLLCCYFFCRHNNSWRRKEGKKERKDWKGEGTEREKCLLISSPFGTFEFPQSWWWSCWNKFGLCWIRFGDKLALSVSGGIHARFIIAWFRGVSCASVLCEGTFFSPFFPSVFGNV